MADSSLYSPSWYRIAHLKPRLRSHTCIHRHHFRGQLWYVLHDRTSGRFVRFTPPAYLVISLMDGRRTVQEIWDQACAHLGDDVLTQDEAIRLLAQLHRSDVLHGDVPPDIAEMSDRAAKQRRRKLAMSFMNPMAVRIPLLDPEEFLRATLPLVRPVMSWAGALVYLVIIGSALVLAGMHWPQLTDNVADRVLAFENVILILITYPLVKAIHELGHAYAVKKWGGEVHEIGIMFLVFMPVPYVDASASAAFQEKWQRMLVGAAGILVELLLAAFALFVWLNVEEGFVRAAAFNVMLIGAVSTLLFNGNPLLRFDGYYVLMDLLEIPNLGTRANRYIGYLTQRYLLNLHDVESPATAPGERFWLFTYAIASFCYRLFIVAVIATFVASRFFVIGVILALWAIILMLGIPLAKQVWFLLTSPLLRRQRGRAFAVCGSLIAGVCAMLLLVPVPHRTLAEGVVWTSGEAAVHARASGNVARVIAAPMSIVVAGDPLLALDDPLLDARARVLEAKVSELERRHAALDFADQAEARIVQEQLGHARADLALARQQQEDLLVRSPAAGQFLLAFNAADLTGRFVQKGTVVAYVAELDRPVVRVIVPEASADLVRRQTRAVAVRFADRPQRMIAAHIERELPSITDSLPSAALSTSGGGKIPLDPANPRDLRALTKLLHLELRPVDARANAIGGRVHVRFDHGPEPLASRLYRGSRQLFLRNFSV